MDVEHAMSDLATNGSTKSRDNPSGLRKFGGILKTKAVYGKEGRSFGNKFLVSLPILNITIPLVFLIASYVYATQKHASFLPPGNTVPFISDIGDNTPQSSLFTFGMALASYATLGVVITRYWQVKHFLVKCDNKTNKAALATGLVFILGKLIVVSFQLSSERAVHFVGAGLYVIFATAYAVIQTVISYRNKSLYGKYEKHIILTRIALVAGMIIGTILFGIFLIPGLTKYNRKGYSVAQSGEWLFACAKTIYMLTFVVDFWPLHPKILLIKSKRPMRNDLVIPNESNADATVLRISYQKYVKNDSNALTTVPE